MNRLRIVMTTLVVGILVSAVGSASASDRPPTLTSTPRATLGARVMITGLFFRQHRRATLYLEAGKTRKRLGTVMVPTGGQLTLKLRLPRSAPKNAHLLACQNNCTWRVRLAIHS
jgi:hypothetical protein